MRDREPKRLPAVVGWGQADMEALPDEPDDGDHVMIRDGEAVMVPKDTADAQGRLLDDSLDQPFIAEKDRAATLEDLS